MQCRGQPKTLADYKHNEQQDEVRSICTLFRFILSTYRTDRLLQRRLNYDFLAAFASNFYSQVLTMSLQRISSLYNFLRLLEEPLQPRLFPELSKGIVFANRNACSCISAVTTCPSFPLCLWRDASLMVASTGLDIRLYGSYFAARVDGQMLPNIISMLFIG